MRAARKSSTGGNAKKMGSITSIASVESQEDWELLGLAPPLDEDTRTYLKRLRKAAPNAKIALPDGFYDSDDEEAANTRERL